MGLAVWCCGVEQDHAVPARSAVARGMLEQLSLNIEADQAAWPGERVRDAEPHGLSRTAARMKNAVLTAAEAQKVATIEGLPYDQVMLRHGTPLLLHLCPL